MADLYSQAVLADSPGLYARMHAASGTTETDASTNAASGTYSGSYTLAQAGALKCSADKSVAFTNGLLTFANSSAINPSTDFTIECWIKSDGSGGSGEAAVQKWASGIGAWQVRRNGSTDNIALQVYESDGSMNFYVTINNVHDSVWHHIVFTGTGTTINAYKDGTLYTTASWTTGSLANTAQLTIGAYAVSNENWTGNIDEVAIYLTALSAARVAAHYQAGVQTGISRILRSSIIGRVA